jgi:hypothetical protein
MAADHDEMVRLRSHCFPVHTIYFHPAVTELVRALAQKRQPIDPIVDRVAKVLVPPTEEPLVRLSTLVARPHECQIPRTPRPKRPDEVDVVSLTVRAGIIQAALAGTFAALARGEGPAFSPPARFRRGKREVVEPHEAHTSGGRLVSLN